MSGEIMTFPKTWEEYEKYWGFNDSDEVYTNNARLIPSFRVKEWLDHAGANDPDLVKVVRCKDCDRSQVDFDRTGNPVYRCRLYDPVVLVVEDDGMGYCSNGRGRD